MSRFVGNAGLLKCWLFALHVPNELSDVHESGEDAGDDAVVAQSGGGLEAPALPDASVRPNSTSVVPYAGCHQRGAARGQGKARIAEWAGAPPPCNESGWYCTTCSP